ncbi:NlpC/P60 family protein, partial [Acidimicrobiaceae bacterium USS-CC1]|nr:NlpC/P60 family protein [Acidiferrimicrobium australe]
KAPLPAPLSTTDVALTWAFAELGVPYLWGGTGAGGFDCSGLTQYVWGKAGVSIPRVAAAQYAWTDPVPLSQLTPGDLVFYGHGYIHHVGIYIGDGLMINAPYTGTVVQVSSIWWSDLAGFGRVHADGTPTASRQVPTPADPIRRVVRSEKPVPSESKPPPGWKPPKHVQHRASSPTSTSAPSTTTAPPSTSTTAPPSTATTSTTSTTTAPSTTSSTQSSAGDPNPSSTTTSPASGSTGPGSGSGGSG